MGSPAVTDGGYVDMCRRCITIPNIMKVLFRQINNRFKSLIERTRVGGIQEPSFDISAPESHF